MNGEFLRKKARRLLLLADACFDADTARQLRLMADEFQTIADREEPVVPLALINGGRGHASGGVGVMREATALRRSATRCSRRR